MLSMLHLVQAHFKYLGCMLQWYRYSTSKPKHLQSCDQKSPSGALSHFTLTRLHDIWHPRTHTQTLYFLQVSCPPLSTASSYFSIMRAETGLLSACMCACTHICASVLVCMIMHMESLECKYASVQLLLNRKSSSRMIESQSVLSVYTQHKHTHKRTLHTLAHIHARTHGGTQSRGLISVL